MNPLPKILTKVSGELILMELGLTLVIVGTGNVLIVSVAGGAEVPPPGWPVKTVTCTMAGVAMSVELITVVRVLELTYVVVRGTPLNCTTEVGENPDPWTVNVNCGPPAATAPVCPAAVAAASSVAQVRWGSPWSCLLSVFNKTTLACRASRRRPFSAAAGTGIVDSFFF